MDFFQAQDKSRRMTTVLLLYFLLAVVGTVALLYFAIVYLVVIFLALAPATIVKNPMSFAAIWHPTLFFWISSATLIIIAVGTLVKMSALRQGGKSIGLLLGGRQIHGSTRNPNERRLLNVVEEIAIACGISVPGVYLLDREPSINAFAAGFLLNDAIIGITQGALENLTRDELQSVIAHEFSHIVNGDMRLNTWLLGILGGLLSLNILGKQLLHSIYRAGVGTKEVPGAISPVVAFGPAVSGTALVVVGYIGCFAAKLIKGAVSREREFLADASAVQFTRNPESLVSVLKKIGGSLQGSKLETLHAEEASHFFFANGLLESFFELLSTHPSLAVRIMRIDPTFDGIFELVATQVEAAGSVQAYKTISATGLNAGTALFSLNPEDVLAQFGTFKPEQLFYASNLLASIPEAIRSCVYEPFGAREVIYCLLLDETATTKTAQLELLKQHTERVVYEQVLSLIPKMEALGPECRLPLVDMALPALKNLSPEQYQNFRDIITKLINRKHRSDYRSSAFELALTNVLLRRLDPIFQPQPAKPYTISQMDKALPSVIDLLGFLAHVGTSDPNKLKQSFQVGIAILQLGSTVELPGDKGFTLEDLQHATEVLKNTAPFVKKPIILACAACISADGEVSVMEAELFRAIMEPLDCPISPFLPQYRANI